MRQYRAELRVCYCSVAARIGSYRIKHLHFVLNMSNLVSQSVNIPQHLERNRSVGTVNESN